MNQGTIISGTCRLCDIIPALLEECIERGLHSMAVNDAERIVSRSEYETDDAHDVSFRLADLLDGDLPEGMFFGAHPDDGADLGYWREL